MNSENVIQAAKDIIKKGLSVREVEKILKKTKRINNDTQLNEFIDFENDLSNKIGLKTKIIYNKEKKNGSLTIKFKDLDQLDHLMKKLK